MIALLAAPATMPRIRRTPAALPRRADTSEIIVNLHKILVNPGATPAEVKDAKRHMLEVLAKGTMRGHPRMIVAPVGMPPAPEIWESVPDEISEDAPTRDVCKRPLAAARFPKRASANSSRGFRANLSDTRYAGVASRATLSSPNSHRDRPTTSPHRIRTPTMPATTLQPIQAAYANSRRIHFAFPRSAPPTLSHGNSASSVRGPARRARINSPCSLERWENEGGSTLPTQ